MLNNPSQNTPLGPQTASPRVAAILAFRHGQYQEVLSLLGPIMSDGKFPHISDSLLYVKTALLLGELGRARPVLAALVKQLNEAPDPDEVADIASPHVAPALWGTVLSEAASLADALGEGASVSRELLERLLRWTRRSGGEDALAVSDVLTRLAGLLLKLGSSADQAVKYLTRALEIRTQKFPNIHARVGDAQGNLGVALRAAGRLRDASEAWKQCLEVREALLARAGGSAEEKKLADAEFAVATLAGELGDLAEGRRMMKRCYERRTKLFGLGHDDVMEAAEKLNAFVAAGPSASTAVIPSAPPRVNPLPASQPSPSFLPRVCQIVDGRASFNPRFSYILHSLRITNTPVITANGDIIPNETVVRLLDYRTGKRISDPRSGHPVYVLNPLMFVSYADEASESNGAPALNDAYGVWETRGGLEIVDRDLQPVRFLAGMQVEKGEAYAARTLHDAVPDFDAVQVANNVENSASDIQRRLALLDADLVNSVDVEPVSAFSEYPKSVRTTLNKLRYYVIFAKKMNVNLAGVLEVHRGLESVMQSDKFFQILRSLHKVAIALQRVPSASKDLEFFTLNETLDIKGNQISLAVYFVQQLKQQKADIWPSFLSDVSFALSLSEESFETLVCANRFVETSAEIARLLVLMDDLPSSDALKADSEYLKNTLPGKAADFQVALKKITETFLDLRAALGLPISGQPIAREISQFFQTLKEFASKLRRADTTFSKN